MVYRKLYEVRFPLPSPAEPQPASHLTGVGGGGEAEEEEREGRGEDQEELPPCPVGTVAMNTRRHRPDMAASSRHVEVMAFSEYLTSLFLCMYIRHHNQKQVH